MAAAAAAVPITLRRVALVELVEVELLNQDTVRAVVVAAVADKELRAVWVVALVAAAAVLPDYPLLLDLDLMAALALPEG